MLDDAARTEGDERRIAELEALVATQAATIEKLTQLNQRLEARVGELERQLGQNSGNSGKPPSRDSAAERQRQAAERQEARQSGAGRKRTKGKQRGAPGSGLKMSPVPDEVVDHRPAQCEGCGAELDAGNHSEFVARQVIDLPEVTPVVTEHRAHSCRCRCGRVTLAAFPEAVRAPVSYGPRVRAVVAYLLARQHLPNRLLPACLREDVGA